MDYYMLNMVKFVMQELGGTNILILAHLLRSCTGNVKNVKTVVT
jgi:hypothetical protein